MTPRTFFDIVVKPNAFTLSEHFGDERCAVNAIQSLDAFFGILYAELTARNDRSVTRFKTDDEYRDDLAARFLDYRILRDMAASLKHGELKRKKPRLVARQDQMKKFVPGAGVMMCGHDRLGAAALFIQLPTSYARPEFTVSVVMQIAERELTACGL
jgi:hypothetical protein